MWRRPFLIGLMCAVISAVISFPALALERPYPKNAQRGIMSPAPFPEIILDGKQRRLAPGARIWNEDNLIQAPASLRGNNFPVNYTVNAEGEIDRVWILSEEEAGQPLAKQVNSQSQ